MGSELMILKQFIESGGLTLVIGLLAFFFWYFYKRQFSNLWVSLQTKDRELAELNERVLMAFERNTAAFEKFVATISRLEKSNERIENKIDKISRFVKKHTTK